MLSLRLLEPLVRASLPKEKQEEAMLAWNLTAKTILSVSEWVELFEEAGYTGDYYWFVP